jgi:SAM-dependent methyltransferase
MTTTADYLLFEPNAYLQDYYAEIPPENMAMLCFLVKSFRAAPLQQRVLDFGSGPTLFAEIVAAGSAQEIHIGEYLPANRAEIQRWLDQAPTCFDWSHYIEAVLKLEGKVSSSSAIQQRETTVRQRVTCVMPCDARSPKPLHPVDELYDMVVSNLCLEAAARDLAEWYCCIRNIASLVKPGGRVMLSAVKGATSYSVGAQVFPVVSIHETDIYHALQAANFLPETIHIEWTPADHPIHPYQGMVFAAATKSFHPENNKERASCCGSNSA